MARMRGEQKEDRKEEREEKLDSRRGYKLEKIREVTAKAYAVATKRKWLVFMIGLGLIAYLVISKGGFGGMSGIFDMIKNFF